LTVSGLCRNAKATAGASKAVFFTFDILENDDHLGKILCDFDFKKAGSELLLQEHAVYLITAQVEEGTHDGHLNSHLTWGLILFPTDKENEFRRVGLVHIPSEDCNSTNGFILRTVVIV